MLYTILPFLLARASAQLATWPNPGGFEPDATFNPDIPFVPGTTVVTFPGNELTRTTYDGGAVGPVPTGGNGNGGGPAPPGDDVVTVTVPPTTTTTAVVPPATTTTTNAPNPPPPGETTTSPNVPAPGETTTSPNAPPELSTSYATRTITHLPPETSHTLTESIIYDSTTTVIETFYTTVCDTTIDGSITTVVTTLSPTTITQTIPVTTGCPTTVNLHTFFIHETTICGAPVQTELVLPNTGFSPEMITVTLTNDAGDRPPGQFVVSLTAVGPTTTVTETVTVVA